MESPGERQKGAARLPDRCESLRLNNNVCLRSSESISSPTDIRYGNKNTSKHTRKKEVVRLRGCNLEGKHAEPDGFQGLHLFFRVPLSGAERGESGGDNGEPERVKRP